MHIEELIQYVSTHLRHESGKVFFSGRSAFEHPAKPLYLISLNPGDSPDDHPDRRLQRNIDNVLSVYNADWSAYQDDPWEGQTSGTRRLRENMLYLCRQLGVHPRRIPTTTLIFARSRNQNEIGARFEDLAQECWPFHQAVIDALKIRVIVCASLTVGRWVRNRLAWEACGERREHGTQRNRYEGRVYQPRANEISVIDLPHPSRFGWKRLETSLTELMRSALGLYNL